MAIRAYFWQPQKNETKAELMKYWHHRAVLDSMNIYIYIYIYTYTYTYTYTYNNHLQPFNGLFSRTTWVSRYQKGKTNLDFTGARDSEWQWHRPDHTQVCTSLQTDNHASTPPLCFLQAGCPSCRPTNSVKALKAKTNSFKYTTYWICCYTTLWNIYVQKIATLKK